MRPSIKQLPPIYGWAATAVFSFVGAYLTSGIYIALTALAAVAAYSTGLYYELGRRNARNALERVKANDIRALAAGRRAEHVRLVVIGRDGSLFTGSLLELIELEPEGFVLSFDAPYHVRVYYHPHTVPEEHRAIAP